MRYAIRHNATPPGEAVVRLRFDAGSLMEREDQLGLAHFIEHMVFNGTRNVPEGEFVRRLERLGLAFGADTNAGTGFDETIYKLDLPNVEANTVDTALLLMREAAGEALLEAEAIERERGVVLSEERTRDGPGLRMGRAQLDFLFKDQLLPRRLPIGTREIIQTAPRERLVEYYNAYYRPENAVLVVVGDFDVDEMERKIRTRFSDWQARGPAGPRPNLGAVAPRGREVRTYIERGVPLAVTMSWNKPPELDPDTGAERTESFREQLAFRVLNRRLTRIAIGANPPFTQATAATGTAYDSVSQTGLSASFRPGAWRPALEALVQEQRRIVQHGISQAELDRAIIMMGESLRAGLASAGTRPSVSLAETILAALTADDVVTTPEDRLARFEQAVQGFTLEQARTILAEHFTGAGPLIFVTSPEPIPGGETAIAQAFDQSSRMAVAPRSATADKPWAYTDFGAHGRVVERREVADLGATFVTFSNGVRLTVRPSKLERDRIYVMARAGDGQLDLPLDRPSPTWAARAALVDGGLRKMTLEEIDDALAGKGYGADVSVGERGFGISGSTRRADVRTQMQVLTAFLTDPGWRPTGVERAKTSQLDALRQAPSSPAGALGLELGRYLYSGDPRFMVQSEEQVRRTSVADVRQMLRPLLTEPIEVVITGDTSVEEAIQLTAETFGALPPRREAGYPAAATALRFPAPPPSPVRIMHDGRADQAMAVLAWPASDYPSDPQKARAAEVLRAILRLRLNDEIRERQAVTYSPSVQLGQPWAYPGFGFMLALIEAAPERLDRFFADALTVARELRDKPVSADELNRARLPLVEAAQREREGNVFWSNSLVGAQRDPRLLALIRENIPGLQRITPADVQRVAREYLRDDKAYRILVLPESGRAPPAGERR